MGRGYSCSPIAYKNTIILTLGGQGQTLIAFNQKDGTVAWKNQTLDMSPASPIIINVDGQDQLIAFLGKVVAGIDPNNGNLLWSHPHVTEWGLNISMPVWGNDNLLFISSAYSGGSRVLKLTQKDGKTTAEELWFHRRMRVHHGTAIRIGDYVYGSSGDFGPAFFAAVNVKTGEIAYQDRRFPKTNFVLADGKLIILGRRRQSGAGNRFSDRTKSDFEGECYEEPRLDCADAGRNETLCARSTHDRRT